MKGICRLARLAVLLVLILNFKISFADSIHTLGDYGQFAVPATAVMVTLLHRDSKGIIQLSEAYLSTLLLTYGLKYTIHSTRPNKGDNHSFPSGHTASAFAGAAYLQQRYGWRYGLPAYLAASFVGYSRVESKNHWTRDVVAGALIGISMNLVFTKPYRWGNVGFYADPKQKGLGIVFNKAW